MGVKKVVAYIAPPFCRSKARILVLFQLFRIFEAQIALLTFKMGRMHNLHVTL